MSVQETLEAIDSKLDEVDALVMSMPLQDSVKRDLVKHIYTMSVSYTHLTLPTTHCV